MEKTATKRKVQMPGKIRQRLSAALCMLLVSTIMMVSSTYAWFTLSTKPEVQSISTSVAGNGSLEVALVPTDGDLSEITSGRGTSAAVAGVKAANVTWGNLVSLDTGYGMEEITLGPAQLAITTTGEGDAAATSVSVSVPEYGNDGRIKQLTDVSSNLKSFVGSAFTGTDKGVRAIVDGAGQTYGYVVDMAFRVNTTKDASTNAKLILAKDGLQRVYSDSDVAATAGDGSVLNFFTDATHPVTSTLKNAVRIAFVQNFGTDSGDDIALLAYAKADSTGKLDLYDADMQAIDGNILLDSMAEDTTYQISAIVWLDGEALKNADMNTVDAVAGTLNLQFTTDVALVPAEDAEVRDGTAAGAISAADLAKNALSAKIAEAQEANVDADTSEAMVALRTAIAAAQGVYEDSASTEANYQEQITALETAIAAVTHTP